MKRHNFCSDISLSGLDVDPDRYNTGTNPGGSQITVALPALPPDDDSSSLCLPGPEGQSLAPGDDDRES